MQLIPQRFLRTERIVVGVGISVQIRCKHTRLGITIDKGAHAANGSGDLIVSYGIHHPVGLSSVDGSLSVAFCHYGTVKHTTCGSLGNVDYRRRVITIEQRIIEQSLVDADHRFVVSHMVTVEDTIAKQRLVIVQDNRCRRKKVGAVGDTKAVEYESAGHGSAISHNAAQFRGDGGAGNTTTFRTHTVDIFVDVNLLKGIVTVNDFLVRRFVLGVRHTTIHGNTVACQDGCFDSRLSTPDKDIGSLSAVGSTIDTCCIDGIL